MEGIIHRSVEVNGITMHVAEKGEGPVVLLLHGFPELWYSWRHQILGLADAGYRAVAPDLRGYGDTDAPPSVSDYSIFHLVGDIVALIDSLGQQQVFVVGHDWGAVVAWNLCLFRPDRVKALVNLSVPFRPRNPTIKPVDYYRSLHGDDHYICRFQEHGVVEEQFVQFGIDALHKAFFSSRNPGPLLIPKEGLQWPKDQISLPSWLSEEDIKYFASKFEKTGFTNPINYYRNMDLNWELTEPWTGAQIQVPTKFIVGDRDLVYNYPGVPDYVLKGGFKKHVPLSELSSLVVLERTPGGTGKVRVPQLCVCVGFQKRNMFPCSNRWSSCLELATGLTRKNHRRSPSTSVTSSRSSESNACMQTIMLQFSSVCYSCGGT